MQQHNGAKILVIDDEAALLRSITAYLEDCGLVALSAENGNAGLKIFANEQPDLVLTDIHMPEVTGLQILNTIVKNKPEIPVIVISGAGELNDAIEALRLGAWDFITKPISDLKVLEHAIYKALERKKLMAENKEYAQKIEQNLKILEDDQKAGRKVQMSLLPPGILKIKDYTFDFKIIPSLELSGDFVEYFSLTENVYVMYLADVSGHGSSSAFITVLLKSLIAQYAAHYRVNQDETILYPAKMLQVLSNEIHSAKLGKYITIIYSVINTTDNEMVYAVGGHYPSPILISKDGTSKYLPGSGFPVGVKQQVDYKEEKLSINSGDAIIMCSDGIMELLTPGASLDQKDKTLLGISAKAHGNIAEILRGSAISEEQGLKQPDDITILALTRS